MKKRGNFDQKEAEDQIFKMLPQDLKTKIAEKLNIEIGETISKSFKNVLLEPEKVANLLLLLCDTCLTGLEKIEGQESSVLDKVSNNNNNNNNLRTYLYNLGLKIIYNFRSLFLKENFVLRYTLKSNVTNAETIVEIDYNELINSGNYLNFSNEEVHFIEGQFQNLISNEKVNSAATQFFDLWNDILKFSGTEDNNFEFTGYTYRRYDKKEDIYLKNDLYVHQTKLENIYRIETNKGCSYYYNKGTLKPTEDEETGEQIIDDGSSSLNYFNRGFLFEWYEQYLINKINSTKIKESAPLNKYRSEFFTINGKVNAVDLCKELLENNKTDNIKGYKAGDIFDEKRRIMYQAKYYNSNSLITFKEIKNGVNKIRRASSAYLNKLKRQKTDNAIKNSTEFFLKELFNIYTPTDPKEFENYLMSELPYLNEYSPTYKKEKNDEDIQLRVEFTRSVK